MKVIYTAIMGSYDNLKDPKFITNGWKYICFTNNKNIKSKVWQVIYVDTDKDLDDAKMARKIKILPHKYLPKFDLSIWVDANLTIGCNLSKFVNQVLPEHKSLSLMTHGQRNCIYLEGQECKKQNKDDHSIIDNQLQEYKNEGYPERYGMVQTGIEVRRHMNPKLIEFNEFWFNEVKKGSKRDQLSFNYSVWKTNFKDWVQFTHAVLFNPEYFQISMHSHGW